jgi:hypothetical protein
MKRILAGLFLLSCLSPRPALAWHQGGHELVARIAWDSLADQPALQARLKRLIGQMPDRRYRDFVEASIWPDAIKSHEYRLDGRPYPKDHVHASWHYKDIPIFEGEAPHPVASKGESILDGLPTEVAILSDKHKLAAERAVALSWVIHLVGDVHQPLHCASLYSPAFEPDPAGDKGGNAFKISGSKATELHAFWDSVSESFPLDINHPPTIERIHSDATHLEHEFPEARFVGLARDLSLQDWIHESTDLAARVAYNLSPGDTPGPAYRREALETCHRRIALAGYRLAHLLQRCLPQS